MLNSNPTNPNRPTKKLIELKIMLKWDSNPGHSAHRKAPYQLIQQATQ